jgi:hypothetical protein
MSNKKKIFIVLGLALAVLFIYDSPPMQQYLLERKIRAQFSDISLPSELQYKSSADFGDVLLGREEDWGVQFNYDSQNVPKELLYSKVEKYLLDSGYSVQRSEGWVLNAQNSEINMRITGFDKVTIFAVRGN